MNYNRLESTVAENRDSTYSSLYLNTWLLHFLKEQHLHHLVVIEMWYNVSLREFFSRYWNTKDAEIGLMFLSNLYQSKSEDLRLGDWPRHVLNALH